MGCAISGPRRIVDSNLLHLNENSSVELISSSLQLINYFKEKENNLPKCIFIFGGSGSNKGEFIYEMICSSWVNYGNEQMYECQQDCQKQKLIKEQEDLNDAGLKTILNKETKTNEIHSHQNAPQTVHQTNGAAIEHTEHKTDHQHQIPQIAVNNQSQNSSNRPIEDKKYSITEQQTNRLWSSHTQLTSTRSSFSNISIKYQDNLNFVYSYIDIERLILDNLKDRIKSLGECGLIGNEDDLFGSAASLDEARGARKKIDRKKDKKIISSFTSVKNKIENEIDERQSNGQDSRLDDVEIANLIDHTVQQTIDLHSQVNWQLEADRTVVSPLDKQLIEQQIDIDKKSNKIDSNELDLCSIDSKQQDETQKQQQNHQSNDEDSIEKADSHYLNSSNSKAIQHYHSKKFSKRLHRQGHRNENWADFLKACEEDFEFNQSKINTNYNSRELRQCMFTYANCVTNNWVFSLIEKEIKRRTQSLKDRFFKLVNESRNKKMNKNLNELDEETNLFEESNSTIHNESSGSHNLNAQHSVDFILPEIIYIINLVPNQINIFRHCLFLQQTPNLNNFNINFIAINLISGDLKKKDLDSVICHSIQEELNYNYMNYFRSINRLTDVQIRQLKQKIRIRITKGKHAIKMNSEADVQMLLGALENNQEIDLSGFRVQNERCRRNSQRNVKASQQAKENEKKGNLLYIIDDTVDIDEVTQFCIEDQTLQMLTLRSFIQAYLEQKHRISFNRLHS